MDAARQELARLDELLATELVQGRSLQASLDQTLAGAAAAVAREHGEGGAGFVEPFTRAGPLLTGTAAARRVPALFVDEGEQQLLPSGSDGGGTGAAACDPGEGWLRQAAAGWQAPEAERAPIISELRKRLDRLEPAEWAQRDALLPLLAPLIPLPELWRTCVAWRDRSPGALQLPAVAPPPAVVVAFAECADAALAALVQDLGLLRSFASNGLKSSRQGGDQLGALGLSGVQLADELIGTRAVEPFGAAMGRLRAAAAAAKAQGDAESCAAAVAAALRCHGQLYDMASRGVAILREVGLAQPSANEDSDAAAMAAGQSALTPRESLLPTPTSVKTPSAITFRELGPATPAKPSDAAGAVPAPAGNGVIWPSKWSRQMEDQVAWLSEAVLWVLSPHPSSASDGGGGGGSPTDTPLRAGVVRLCSLTAALGCSSAGPAVWLPTAVRDAVASGGSRWLTNAFLLDKGQRAPPRQRWHGDEDGGGSTSDGAQMAACACVAAAALPTTTSGSSAAPLLRGIWEAYRQEVASLASDHVATWRSTVLADLDNGQHWLSHRPFLPNKSDEAEARCSYALLMWRFSLAGVEHELVRGAEAARAISGGGGGGGGGGVSGLPLPAMASDVMVRLLVESLESVVRLTVTRARAFQLQTDAMCVVTIVWDFRERHFASPSGGGGRLDKLRQHLDELCGLLLRSVALLTAPLPAVLTWLGQYTGDQAPRIDSGGASAAGLWSTLPWLPLAPVNSAAIASVSSFNPVTEMSKLTSGGLPGEAWDLTTQPWFPNRGEGVPWAALLRIATPPLEPDAALSLLRRRTELREGDYPALTLEEEALTATLKERLPALAALAGAGGSAEPEPEPPKFVKAFSDDDY